MPTAAEVNVPLEMLADNVAWLYAARNSMAADQLAIRARNWPERAAFGSAAAVNTALALAFAPSLGGLTGGTYFLLDVAKTLYVSADGQQWSTPATLTNASAIRPQLAVGNLDGAPIILSNANTNFYTSPDSTTWTARTTGTTSMSGCPAYAPSLNRWVFVGSLNIDYAAATTAGMSAWTAASVPAAWTSNSGGCKRLIWTGGHFLALPVGSYNKVLESPDGITWTERTLPATALWTGLAYSSTDAIVMAVNSNAGNAAISADGGVTWTAPTGTGYTVANDLAVQDSLWVVATNNGNYGGIAWSRDKGASWTKGPSVGKHTVATGGWNRILAGDGRFVVAHIDGTNAEVALSLRGP